MGQRVFATAGAYACARGICRIFTSVTVIFFDEPATTDIYTLSLHDALPIYVSTDPLGRLRVLWKVCKSAHTEDRKSTRLNSSHPSTSYAVFCLKKKMCLEPRGPKRARAAEDTSSHAHSIPPASRGRAPAR